ncbi:MAG: hypothetical protein RLW61_03675 [Gammaproteobacteria bacterium]
MRRLAPLLLAGVVAALAVTVALLPWRAPYPPLSATATLEPPVRVEGGAARAPHVTASSQAGSTDAATDRGGRDARSRAQDALATTLERFQALAARDATRWARGEMHAIEQRIGRGEKAYRETRYADAQARYAEATQLMSMLTQTLPARAAALVDSGGLALEHGDSAAAAAAFAQALVMDPEHAAARAGAARARTLDQVLALLDQAAGNERRGDTDKALAAYREALALDSAAPGAAAAIARIERGRRAADFRAALGAGLGALAQQDFASARAALARARALDANDPALVAAIAHTDRAETAWRIEQALAEAGAAARAERWADAVGHYDRALAADRALVEARRARDLAQARAKLDAALGTAIAAPRALVDDAAHAAASDLLSRARAIDPAGERLAAQVARLRHALALARTPVRVRLRSDGITALSLDSAQDDPRRLGRVTEQVIALRPGRYVAHGRCDGGVPLRVEFELVPGSAESVVDAACPAPPPTAPE